MSETSGVLLIDKPIGPSSHFVVNNVRHALNIKRVGHTGTLDPFASGLLILLVGKEFTRTQPLWHQFRKTYRCVAWLGVGTNTGDRLGEVIEATPWAGLQVLTKERVAKTVQSLIGQVSYIAPAFSAIKIGGTKLYDRARRGTLDEVELPMRTSEVYRWELERFEFVPERQVLELEMELECNSGTYVRSLVEVLGKKLGVPAMAQDLRRTAIGPCSIEEAKKLGEFSANDLWVRDFF